MTIGLGRQGRTNQGPVATDPGRSLRWAKLSAGYMRSLSGRGHHHGHHGKRGHGRD